MGVISYEEARRFREAASAPLSWDESIPAPPLNRIEFTRLILQAAVNAGLPAPEWNVQLNDAPSFEARLRDFQRDVQKHTARQIHKGLPNHVMSVYSNGLHLKLQVLPKWSEYIEILEEDYFGFWKNLWFYGGSPGSYSHILKWLGDKLWKVEAENRQWYEWQSGNLEYVADFEYCGEGIREDAILFESLSSGAVRDFLFAIDREFDLECRLFCGILFLRNSCWGLLKDIKASGLARHIVVNNRNRWLQFQQKSHTRSGRPR